jgi:hypothetical protein
MTSVNHKPARNARTILHAYKSNPKSTKPAEILSPVVGDPRKFGLGMRIGAGKAPWHYISVDGVGSGVGELAHGGRQGDAGGPESNSPILALSA